MRCLSGVSRFFEQYSVGGLGLKIDILSEEDERSQKEGEGKGQYAFIKSTGGGGGTSYQISIEGGSLGEALAELFVPPVSSQAICCCL